MRVRRYLNDNELSGAIPDIFAAISPTNRSMGVSLQGNGYTSFESVDTVWTTSLL